jgi:hypothetical protein
MEKIDSKLAGLFKKAYFYNWDKGLGGLKKLLADQKCDLATAKMIFWHGQPNYYYNYDHAARPMADYEAAAFVFLQALEKDILEGKYAPQISYVVEQAFVPADLGKIPAAMLEPVLGVVDYMQVLYPNRNPFQDEILALVMNCNSVDQMYALAQKGADFSAKILDGYAFPMQVAANHGQVEAIKYFAENGFDLNTKFHKSPMLFEVLANGRLELIQYLVTQDIDLNAKGAGGETVLHYAAMLNTRAEPKILEAVAVLLQHGANPQLLNSKKKSAVDSAQQYGKTALLDLYHALS